MIFDTAFYISMGVIIFSIVFEGVLIITFLLKTQIHFKLKNWKPKQTKIKLFR